MSFHISLSVEKKLSVHAAEIPPMILFNRGKHHLKYLQAVLVQARKGKEEMIARNVLTIGNNISDLYYGAYSPAQISHYILHELKRKGISDDQAFREWLFQGEKNYVNIGIKDFSNWTLLPAVSPRFIHIHPARYSPLSMRVKALTLKLAIWISYEVLKNEKLTIDMDYVNLVRKERLQSSPLRYQSSNDKLKQLIQLLLSFENIRIADRFD